MVAAPQSTRNVSGAERIKELRHTRSWWRISKAMDRLGLGRIADRRTIFYL
jgi:hypothetical protein